MFHKKAHTGMTHKVYIGAIGQVTVGVKIVPTNFKFFDKHVQKFLFQNYDSPRQWDKKSARIGHFFLMVFEI